MKSFFASLVPYKALYAALALAPWGSALLVQGQDLEIISDREIVRRQENLIVGEKLISAGDKAMTEKDYAAAYTNYLDALNAIPGGAGTAELRSKTSIQIHQSRTPLCGEVDCRRAL